MGTGSDAMLEADLPKETSMGAQLPDHNPEVKRLIEASPQDIWADSTEVLRSETLRALLLKARGWPAGEAHVRPTLDPRGNDRTELRIAEDAVAGPGALVPRPARQALIAWRNTESLRRLAYLAEGEIQSRGTA